MSAPVVWNNLKFTHPLTEASHNPGKQSKPSFTRGPHPLHKVWLFCSHGPTTKGTNHWHKMLIHHEPRLQSIDCWLGVVVQAHLGLLPLYLLFPVSHHVSNSAYEVFVLPHMVKGHFVSKPQHLHACGHLCIVFLPLVTHFMHPPLCCTLRYWFFEV